MQPQRSFLQYRYSVTMINIVKKYLWKKINELNCLIGFSDEPQAQNKYIACCVITTSGCFRSFDNVRLQSFRFFQKLTPYLHIFFFT